MSGPTSVIFTGDLLTLLLAAAAIRAARAVQAGYHEAADLGERHAARRSADTARQETATAAGQAALDTRCREAEQRHARLCELSVPYGAAAALRATLPPRPAGTDAAELAAYLEHVLALNERLETGLHAMLAGDENAPPAGLSLDALAAMQASAAPPEPTAAVRLLARAAALGPLPEDIERLARELSAATGQERRELLEIELRRAIQRFQEEAARVAGALVLQQTLEDLGYQVEGVSETLFVEGGLVHFRRPGWGDYQVRLRVKAHAGGSGFEAGANFNVVRAVDAGDNERSVLDHLAEDRWCAEFPALLQALALRGLRLEVTRRLAAGELPVQLVERAQLPRFTDEDAARPPTQLRQKEIR